MDYTYRMVGERGNHGYMTRKAGTYGNGAQHAMSTAGECFRRVCTVSEVVEDLRPPVVIQIPNVDAITAGSGVEGSMP